ncbi:hypothetical protein O181_051457 [Austropuccinia psidii MF-1]|uniref:Reverse transcriptase RNase H-like domain-containing protein n=1 Tax=Austropuccinia psidii MF-1 TaxID=1389203 RepID=A0A9Q3E5Q6_9BASI|nr:hypothetical protein [Austropuccinia psidii MF-1]
MFPYFELPFTFYIYTACIQGLGAAHSKREVLDGEPREGVICYIFRKLKDPEARYGETQNECLCLAWTIEKLNFYLEGAVFEAYTDYTELNSFLNINTTNRHMLWRQIAIQEYKGNMPIIYKEGGIHNNGEALSRLPLENIKQKPAYDPEVPSEIPFHFMEIGRKKNFRFSEWAPGSGSPDDSLSEPEEIETLILGISSSELPNEFSIQSLKLMLNINNVSYCCNSFKNSIGAQNWNCR